MERWHISNRSTDYPLLWAVALAYTVLFTYFSYVRFMALDIPTFDFGIKIQATYTAISGIPVDNSDWAITGGLFPQNYFAIHLTPFLFIVSPITHIFSSAITILVLQWGAIAAAAVVLHAICIDFGIDRKTAFSVFVIFLMFPPTLMSGFYYMHFLAMFPFASLWLYRSLRHNSWFQSLAAFLLGVSFQEAFLLIVPFIAVQLVVDHLGFKSLCSFRKWRKIDLAYVLLAIFSVGLFFIELQIMQYVAPSRENLFIASSGYTYSVSANNLLIHLTSKLIYLALVLGMLLFIPFIGWKKSLMVFPGFILVFFTSRITFFELMFQYSFTFTAGLFLAFAEGICVLGKQTTQKQDITFNRISIFRKELGGLKLQRVAVVITIILLLVFSPLLPIAKELPDSTYVNPMTKVSDVSGFNTLIGMVSNRESVLASDYLFPHVAEDSYAYPIIHSLYNSSDSLAVNYSSSFSPDYILIFPSDFHSAEKLVTSFPSEYGLRAEASVNVTSTFNQQESPLVKYVLLYEKNFTGAPRYLAGHSIHWIGAENYQINHGMLINESNSSLYRTAISENYSKDIPFLMFHGPSNSTYNFVLIPGFYSLVLHLKIDTYGQPLSSLVFQVYLYANNYKHNIALFNVSYSDLTQKGILAIHFNFSLPVPAEFFAMSATALKYGYGFTFYGANIIQEVSSVQQVK